MSKTFYLTGSTCTGKDYFIELAVKKHPHLFGKVQVGQALRAKYPAEYFKGSGAPEHTEKEAISIFKEQWNAAQEAGRKYILVSGQPRRPSQVEECFKHVSSNHGRNIILFLHTPDEIIKERIAIRFENDDEGYKLAEQRTVSDKIMFYDTIFTILEYQQEYPEDVLIKTLDTQTRNIEEVIDQIAHFGSF